MWYTIKRNLLKEIEGRNIMYFIGSMLAVFLIPLILIFSFGLPILAAVLVYKDAAKRVDCSPWLWAIVAALAPCFIGVIVYLIIRKDYPLMSAGGERYHTYPVSYTHLDVYKRQSTFLSAATKWRLF